MASNNVPIDHRYPCLYVRFRMKEWTRLPRVVKPCGNFVYSHLFTTKYILDRGEKLAELRYIILRFFAASMAATLLFT